MNQTLGLRNAILFYNRHIINDPECPRFHVDPSRHTDKLEKRTFYLVNSNTFDAIN